MTVLAETEGKAIERAIGHAALREEVEQLQHRPHDPSASRIT
jgi:hypothetical protein